MTFQFAIKSAAVRALLAGTTALFLAQPALAALALQHWKLPSGAEVWLAESPAIPMLDVQIDFDAGSRRDPPAQSGLASAMAAMMSRGIRAADGPGARGDYPAALDENQLSEAWADLGASFDASTDSDRLSFSLRSLTYPDLLARATQLASRQIAAPAFPADIWQRDRERMVASIKEANTRPGTIAGKAFAQAVYGDHPYGRQTTEETLARISVADMQALHERHVLACRAHVILVGAVTRAQAETLVNTLLSRLPAGSPQRCAPLPPVPEVAALAAPSEQRIPFESAQAHVFIGQPGIKRADPDYFPLIVGNYILGGGGFVSRLTNEVREKRGLSYSVYSYFAPARHAGAFTLGLQTRPDQADQAVQVAREVLRQFVAEGPTEAELQAAKDNLIGGFALRIDSNRKLLGNIAGIAWNQLPLDYLDTWTQQVSRVTVADVRAAFARTLQPQRMATVIVGARH
ncbi:MAG: insulinase family protein [Ramlibacter sp.]|nr:insulinase family protein [Ramlibacter sp.]